MGLGNVLAVFSVILMQSKVRIKCPVYRAYRHFLFYSVASVFSLGQVGVMVLPVGKSASHPSGVGNAAFTIWSNFSLGLIIGCMS